MKKRSSKNLAILLLCIVLIMTGLEQLYGQKKDKNKSRKKDPIEVLRMEWSDFTFEFGKNWEVERFITFLLRTPEFLENYYAILQERTTIDPAEIENEMKLISKYLVFEVNIDALDKKELEKDWNFSIEVKNIQKETFDLAPISVEGNEITMGKEYVTGFQSFQPVTVVKKQGNITVESITPSFYLPERSKEWCRTFILYFPANYPDSEKPILSPDTDYIYIVAKYGGFLGEYESGKLKFKKLPFVWNE